MTHREMWWGGEKTYKGNKERLSQKFPDAAARAPRNVWSWLQCEGLGTSLAHLLYGLSYHAEHLISSGICSAQMCTNLNICVLRVDMYVYVFVAFKRDSAQFTPPTPKQERICHCGVPLALPQLNGAVLISISKAVSHIYFLCICVCGCLHFPLTQHLLHLDCWHVLVTSKQLESSTVYLWALQWKKLFILTTNA